MRAFLLDLVYSLRQISVNLQLTIDKCVHDFKNIIVLLILQSIKCYKAGENVRHSYLETKVALHIASFVQTTIQKILNLEGQGKKGEKTF